jgi:NADH-quinone oxidoreductase subunit J
MTGPVLIAAGSAILLAIGLWLVMPRSKGGGRVARAGGGLALLAGVIGLFSLAPWPADASSNLGFILLAAVTVAAAVCTISFRNPVYCALWFALTLLGTAGLFLALGAQFLALATVVVYAGAIVVTFLFVLMLAQPEGHASYDRVSWEAGFSSTAAAILVGILTWSMGGISQPPLTQAVRAALADGSAGLSPSDVVRARWVAGGTASVLVVDVTGAAIGSPEEAERVASQLSLRFLGRLPGPTSDRITVRIERADFESTRHVAGLGGQLFGRHLVGVQAAGALLLAALVGAAAILGPGGRLAGRVETGGPAHD